MQSMINDLEALKDISSPLSASTSISMTPPPLSNPIGIIPVAGTCANNNINISPSSSLSSSSYANSSKASSLSEANSNTNRTLSSISAHSIEPQQQNVFHQSLASHKSVKQQEGNKSLSLSKRIKRFLSLNSSKRSDEFNQVRLSSQRASNR